MTAKTALVTALVALIVLGHWIDFAPRPMPVRAPRDAVCETTTVPEVTNFGRIAA